MARKILGIELTLKTDIVAALAFIISFSGLLVGFYQYVKGSDIEIFPPARVLIFPGEYFEQKQFVRICAY